VEYLLAHRFLASLDPFSNELRAHAEHLGKVLLADEQRAPIKGAMKGLSLLVPLLLAGCATSYQPEGAREGFSDVMSLSAIRH
jgi:hypothetical protein